MEQWNGGKMEYWVSKADDGRNLISDECEQNKIDLIPPGPAFQYSIIPVPHDIRLQQPRLWQIDLAQMVKLFGARFNPVI